MLDSSLAAWYTGIALITAHDANHRFSHGTILHNGAVSLLVWKAGFALSCSSKEAVCEPQIPNRSWSFSLLKEAVFDDPQYRQAAAYHSNRLTAIDSVALACRLLEQ